MCLPLAPLEQIYRAVSLTIIEVICRHGTHHLYEGLLLDDIFSVSVIIQGEVVSGNGAAIRYPVLQICQPIRIIIAVACPCPIEMIKTLQSACRIIFTIFLNGNFF